MSEELEIKTERQLHPCQYCKTMCYGFQCKNCHLKMIAEKQSNCIDCIKPFNAKRKNGTFKKRCFGCQDNYNKKYISKCITCNNDFHAYLDDGRVFDRCLLCYKNSFKKCNNCDNNTREEYSLCKSCYRNDEMTVPMVLS
jgi:hypothetical protein